MAEETPQQPQPAPIPPEQNSPVPAANPAEEQPVVASSGSEPAANNSAEKASTPSGAKATSKSLPTAQQLPSLVGEEISGCEILQKTAAGGMGAVYRARHKALDRIVCVKILAPALANDKKAVDLFLTEARAIAELDHPNIVNVYNVGKEKGYYFIVMSFIEGQTLSQMLRKQKQLPIGLVLDLFEGVLLGLQAAHEKGIIHRDIKPSNILIDPNMQPKVVDFGIAKKVDKEKGAAKSTELAGTAYFIAPEQAIGKVVDTRADLYAVGASLYYVLTGHFPYNGKNTMEIIQKHIKDPIPNPANLRPEIPVWLAQAIQKLMSKKPENRFRTAKEVVDFFRKMRADDQLRLQEGNAGKAINLSQEGGLKLSGDDDFLPKQPQAKKPELPRKLMETEGLVRPNTASLPTMETALPDNEAQPATQADPNSADKSAAQQEKAPLPDLSMTLQDEVAKEKKSKFVKSVLLLCPFFIVLTICTSYIFYKLGAICAAFAKPDYSIFYDLFAPFVATAYAPNQLFFMGAAIACLIVIIASSKIKSFAPYTLSLLALAALSYLSGILCPNIAFLDMSGVAGNLLSPSCFAGYLMLSVILAWFMAKTYNRSFATGVLGVAFLALSIALSYLTAHTSQPPAFGVAYVNALLYATMGCAMCAIYYLLMPSKRNTIILPVILMLGAVGCMWFFTLSGVSEKTINELNALISRLPVKEVQATQQPDAVSEDLAQYSQHANTYVKIPNQTEFSNKSEEQILEVIRPRITQMVPDETFTEQTFEDFTAFLAIYYHSGLGAMKRAVWLKTAQIPFQRFREDAPDNHIMSLLLFLLIIFNVASFSVNFIFKKEIANDEL